MSSSRRTDWLDHRAAFFRAQAAEQFSPSPVASEFEVNFASAYADACASSAQLLDLADFAEDVADHKPCMSARWTAAVAAAASATAGFTVAGWVLAAVLVAVGFVVGAYGGGALGAYRAEA